MKDIIVKLRNRWGVKSLVQVVIILFVFALAGFSTLFVHRQINSWLGITPDTDFWLRFLVFILIIIPLYTLILYVWGLLLGQKPFFNRFIRAKLRLIYRRNVTKLF